MFLNTIRPAKGAKKTKTRLARGIGSGLGKTAGRGHKGQHARAGGYHKVGFEGGQMPLQRRLPKFGFNSIKARTTAEIRLHELNKVSSEIIDLAALRTSGLINRQITRVRIIAKGKVEKPFTIKGLAVTAGAKIAIEAVGGKVE